jgi:hypothetical protein
MRRAWHHSMPRQLEMVSSYRGSNGKSAARCSLQQMGQAPCKGGGVRALAAKPTIVSDDGNTSSSRGLPMDGGETTLVRSGLADNTGMHAF